MTSDVDSNEDEGTCPVSKEMLKCARLARELNHQDVACLCPVSPSQGTCGIPTSFDLFGGNLNIFHIPIGWTGKKNMAESDDYSLVEKNQSLSVVW